MADDKPILNEPYNDKKPIHFTSDQIECEFDRITRLSHIEMALLRRFAPPGHPYFDERYPFFEHFKMRFQMHGGMNNDLSRAIGLDYNEMDKLYLAIETFCTFMRIRLMEKYSDGFGGWDEMTDDSIAAMKKTMLNDIEDIDQDNEQCAKAMVDLANKAMFLFYTAKEMK